MTDILTMPILSELISGGFRWGLNLVVEFESNSLWYETSLTFACHALKTGAKTDYHTFQHIPSEIVENLTRLGLNVQKLQEDGLFRILDTYTFTTGVGAPEQPKVGRPPYQAQSVRLSDWSISAARAT